MSISIRLFKELRLPLSLCFLGFLLFSFAPSKVVFSSILQGEKTPEGNQLTWSTTSELGCTFFMVEKSTNGIDFTTLATLPATTLAENERAYHYFDKQEKSNRVFYRLVDIEKNGTGHFSHEIVLSEKSERAKFFLKEVFASASHKDYRAKVDCKKAGTFNYRVMTTMGELLLKGDIPVQTGLNEVKIPTSTLAVGSYQLALRMENDIEIFKIQKLNAPAVPEVNFALTK